jgi:hypothetical protein
MTSANIIFNIWSQLWETSAGYDAVAPVANSYFAYLQKRSETLRKHLTKELGRNVESTNESVTYSMWVTLGPSLVEGYRILLGLGTKPPLLPELKKLEDKLEEPEAWRDALGPLIKVRPHLKILRTPFIGALNRLQQDIDAAESSLRDSVGPNLRHSYILGILYHKHPWDPPECVSGATRIIEQAAKLQDPSNLRRQANILASMPESLAPQKIVFRAQQLAKRWIRQEEEYVSKVRIELGVKPNE